MATNPYINTTNYLAKQILTVWMFVFIKHANVDVCRKSFSVELWNTTKEIITVENKASQDFRKKYYFFVCVIGFDKRSKPTKLF